MPVTVRMPAKINIALQVGPAREDGFHELATIYHAVSLYDVDLASLGLTLSQCEREGHFLKPDGDRVLIRSGSQSWAGILLEQRPPARWLGQLMEHQPVRAVADAVYAYVARNRHRLPR